MSVYTQKYNNNTQYDIDNIRAASSDEMIDGAAAVQDVEDAKVMIGADDVGNIDASHPAAQVTNDNEPVLDNDARLHELADHIEIAYRGFSSSILGWPGDIFRDTPFSVGEGVLLAEQAAINEVFASLRADAPMIIECPYDQRIPLVSLGIVLAAFAEAGYFGDSVRLWQQAFVLMVADFYIKIACGMIREYMSSVLYPPFLNSPLVTQPTGSGKTFAGLLTTFAMMIRTKGDRVALMTPRNGHMVWCVPTQTLVDDIRGQFEAILATSAFRSITQRNVLPENISRVYITVGRGGWSPDVKNRMVCVMTYEHARTQLLCSVLEDKYDPSARRPPLMTSLRLCVLDEAHYLVKGGDRALVVDNILAACRALCVPVLMLTATPDWQLGNFSLSLQQMPITALPLPEMHFDGRSGVHPNTFRTKFMVTAVDSEMMARRAPMGNYPDPESLLAHPNKLICFRCLMDCMQPHAERRAILFIQNIRSVQLMASYLCGLYVSLMSRGGKSACIALLQAAADEYANTEHMRFEKRFYLKKVRAEELVKCFAEGVSDILSMDVTSDVRVPHGVRAAFSSSNFITYLCFKHRIVPYFSGIALDEGGKELIRDLILSGGRIDRSMQYRVVVTTSVVLEGVNISGAENLYITADGYMAINNTQYVQLTGRVGRHCDGYVDTWIPVAITNNAITITKRDTVQHEDQRKPVQRMIESDDMIDRILFMQQLYNIIYPAPGSASSLAKEVNRLSVPSIRNNYFRGFVMPRISSFFVPARMPPSLWICENQPPHIVSDEDMQRCSGEFLAQFDSPMYRKFFNMFMVQKLTSSTPHIILNTITYVDFFIRFLEAYCNSVKASGQADPRDKIVVPTALFVPLFATFSFAFDFNNMDDDKLAELSNTVIFDLRAVGVDVDIMTANPNVLRRITRLFMKIYPGKALSNAKAANIDSALIVFTASLVLSPLHWFSVFHIRFCDALSVVCPYLRALNQLILAESSEKDSNGYFIDNPYQNTWYGACLRHMIEMIDSVLTFVNKAIEDFRNTEDANSLRSMVRYKCPLGKREMKLSVLEYVCQAITFRTEDVVVDAKNGNVNDVLKDFVYSTPRSSSSYIIK